MKDVEREEPSENKPSESWGHLYALGMFEETGRSKRDEKITGKSGIFSILAVILKKGKKYLVLEVSHILTFPLLCCFWHLLAFWNVLLDLGLVFFYSSLSASFESAKPLVRCAQTKQLLLAVKWEINLHAFTLMKCELSNRRDCLNTNIKSQRKSSLSYSNTNLTNLHWTALFIFWLNGTFLKVLMLSCCLCRRNFWAGDTSHSASYRHACPTSSVRLESYSSLLSLLQVMQQQQPQWVYLKLHHWFQWHN